jgi:ABC-2 type transport system permease protein
MTTPHLTAAKLVAARQEGGLSRTLNDIFIMTRRNLLLDFRNPEVIVGATAFPVSLLLIFTASFAKVVMPSGNYADYAQFIVPLSIVQGLLFSTVTTGTSLYNDLESGMDNRLRTLPISRLAILAGRILGSAGRLLAQVIIITFIGYLLGFRFHHGFLATLLFLFLPIIFALSFTWMAILSAVKARTAESVEVTMFPWLLPLTFLSIGYVPKAGFPEWLQGFVELNPISCITQALRGLSASEPIVEPVIKTLLWSLILTLLFSTLAIRAYERRSH